jgi:hypothetical protein
LDAAVSDVVKSRTLRSSGSCSRVPCTALSPHRLWFRQGAQAQDTGAGNGQLCVCVRAHECTRAIIACVYPPLHPPSHAPAPPAHRRRHCLPPAHCRRCRRSGSCPHEGAAATPDDHGVRLDVPPARAPRSAPSPAAAQARAQIVRACWHTKPRAYDLLRKLLFRV